MAGLWGKFGNGNFALARSHFRCGDGQFGFAGAGGAVFHHRFRHCLRLFSIRRYTLRWRDRWSPIPQTPKFPMSRSQFVIGMRREMPFVLRRQISVSSDVYRAMAELYQSGYFFELFRLVILSIDCIGEEDSLSQP